jgi:HEPN domain-containing protein
MKDKCKYWLELSDYDIETAEAMFNTKRFLYVGFMCHQAVEKILKAYYNKVYDEPAPYTHNLFFLVERSKLASELSEEQKDLIDQLEPLNIESRYPSHKEKIFKTLSEEYCVQIINKTKELLGWIKERL